MKKIQRFSLIDTAILGSGLVLASILSLGNISRWSVWFDEAFSAMLAHQSFSDIAHYTASDVHPPLYYWTLKIWTMLWGSSPLALRSLSLVFLLATIGIVFVFVRRIFGRMAAALTTLLLAIAPMLIRYSEEARMYTMAAFIVAAATVLLYSAMQHPTRGKWIGYGVLVGLGMLTHYMTIVMWASHWIWRWLEVGGKTTAKKIRSFFSKEWLYALVVAFAVIAAWLPFMFKQAMTIHANGFWIGAVSIDTLSNYLTNLYLYKDHNQVYGWAIGAFVTLLILAGTLSVHAYRLLTSERRRAYRLVAIMALLPPIILLLGSLPPFRPSFVDRYILASIIFWAAWAGITYTTLLQRRGRWQWLAAAALIINTVLNSAGLVQVYAIGNFNKDNNSPHAVGQLMELVSRESKSGEPIVAETSWTFYEVAYYETSRNPAFFRSEDNIDNGAYQMLRDNTKQKIVNISEFSKSHDSVWLIVRKNSIDAMTTQFKDWRVVKVLQVPDIKSQMRAVEIQQRK
jgi:uncharacterized membrane protein